MSVDAVPLWAQILVGCLLLLSAALTLAAAWGVLRLDDFFKRLHPPALALRRLVRRAGLDAVLFAARRPAAAASWLIVIVLSVTVPVTTVILSRAALFRERRKPSSGANLPPPLHPAPTTESPDGAPPPDAR
jgi:multicomponent K+:H+ antiporter subunit G